MKLILHVDDDKVTRKLVSAFLGATYEVKSVATGEAALTAVRQYSPDLVILDVRLPGMSGTRISELLAEDPLLRELPVLFVTATVSDLEAETLSHRANGHPVLTKPIDREKFVAMVASCLDQATL